MINTTEPGVDGAVLVFRHDEDGRGRVASASAKILISIIIILARE
jgi:hypothetical protein